MWSNPNKYLNDLQEDKAAGFSTDLGQNIHDAQNLCILYTGSEHH